MDDIGYQGRSQAHQERMFKAGNPAGLLFSIASVVTTAYFAVAHLLF